MSTSVLIGLTVAFALICILSVVFFKQLKGIFVLMLHTCLGWAGLYIFNLIFSGVAIGINIASATVVGILGIPGLILMVILKLLYK